MNSAQAPKPDPEFVKALSLLLEEECAVHQHYLEVLGKEQIAVSNLKSEDVATLSTEREALYERMAQISQKRQQFLTKFPESENKKLSEILVKNCHIDDIKQLSPLVKKLKLLLDRSRRAGNEMGQITDFALRMVNGTMSILWSATQNITRSYTKGGVAKESFQSLKNDTLKQA